MFRPSKKLLFAIEAVLDIAYHGGTEPVRSTAISERQGIPRRYLEQVLQQLVHDGILSGQRGPRGGYRLARERRRITVGEIARVLARVEGTADAAKEEPGSELASKVIRPLWEELEAEILARFEALTIEDLCDRARREGVESAVPRVPDFSI